jgi:hypothetical protein
MEYARSICPDARQKIFRANTNDALKNFFHTARGRNLNAIPQFAHDTFKSSTRFPNNCEEAL